MAILEGVEVGKDVAEEEKSCSGTVVVKKAEVGVVEILEYVR